MNRLFLALFVSFFFFLFFTKQSYAVSISVMPSSPVAGQSTEFETKGCTPGGTAVIQWCHQLPELGNQCDSGRITVDSDTSANYNLPNGLQDIDNYQANVWCFLKGQNEDTSKNPNGDGQIDFTVNSNISPPPGSSAPLPNPCANSNYQECDSALGPLAATPANFIKQAYSSILSMAGGIAILLIIMSGYTMMTSQGNPERVKAAQERLTAAIVGLLFIIFSFVILQVIGVDILGLPTLLP